MQNSQSSQGVVARTKRLVLRKMIPEDLDDLYAVYQSWGVVEGVVPLSQDREEEYEKLCSYMNFENCGMVLGTGCGTPEMTKESVHMQKAYQLGKSV